MNLFITGTDTGVGKTYFTALLLRGLRSRGVDAVGFKPICCGERTDAEILGEAAGGVIPIDDVNPVWFQASAAPYVAALAEGRAVDLKLIRRTYRRLCAAHETVLVEGVGGWAVPIRADYRVSDLAVDFALPVVVVATNRLGVINHTTLTLEAIRAAGLKCHGLVLNSDLSTRDSIATSTDATLLEALLKTRVIAQLSCDQETLREAEVWNCVTP